jgi:hypothetical protein
MVLASKTCLAWTWSACVEQDSVLASLSRVEMQHVRRFRYGATVEETTRNFATIAVIFSGGCDTETLNNHVVHLHVPVMSSRKDSPVLHPDLPM